MSEKKQATNFNNYQEVKLKNVIKAEWNYKTDDDARLQVLINNIKENGQLENIIVRELGDGRYECVNGNHRLEAFKALNYEKVLVYNLGTIPLRKAKKIAVQTNETKFDANSLKLAEIITDISEEFTLQEMVNTMPYTVEDINNFKAVVDFDFGDLGPTEPPKDDTQTKPKTKPALTDEIDPIKTVLLRVEESVYLLWREWVNKVNNRLGYESENKAFEIAIVEALNLPDDHLN